MLLQKLSPPNHVILRYRGDAEALLDQVSHSSPELVGGAGGGVGRMVGWGGVLGWNGNYRFPTEFKF